MKKNIHVFIPLLAMLGILAWCITQHDDRIIFPILMIFLMVILHWRTKIFLAKVKEENTLIEVRAGYFKYPKLVNAFFSILLFGLIMLNACYLKDANFFYIILIPYFIVTLGIMYFISAKNLVFNTYGVSYTLWRVKWDNIKNFRVVNGTLTIETLNGKTRIVKNIDSGVCDEIIDLINQKIKDEK